MEYVVSAKQMKEYDRYTIEECNVPSLVLMENAAMSVKEEICNRFSFDHSNNPLTVLISVGMGNNGGDGLALARMLKEEGWIVEIILLGDESKSTTEWKIQKNKLDSLAPIYSTKPNKDEYTVIVDAVFGIGLTRDVTGIYEEVINHLNDLIGYKVAIDIASGIHSDTGQIMNCVFKADLTVTFAFRKLGHCLGRGRVFSGKVVVKDIGISKSLAANPKNAMMFTDNVYKYIGTRQPDGNKGTFGKVLLIAGFEYMCGAAILAARAAYRTGCGMVKVISPLHNREILQTAVPEALYGDICNLETSLDWCDVIAIGPGLGTGDLAKEVLDKVISYGSKTLVIDADAINLLSQDERLKELLKSRNENYDCVLTPHMGEFSRLCKVPVVDLKKDVIPYVENMSAELNATIVCKDHTTVIASPCEITKLNLTGNSGMATAGSGDVLTGIIASLLAQRLETSHGAAIGVYLHGLAGDKAANILNEYSVMAGDIVDCISELLQE